MMTQPYIVFVVLFSILAYMMAVDKNVVIFIDLLFKLIKINIEKYLWLIKHHPNNPITKWIIWRKSLEIAKQLEKEFEEKHNAN
jgi:hypothetical protein